VLFFEHKGLYNVRGDVVRVAPSEPLGRARILRDGADVTIVGAQLTASRALAAADELGARGVSAEVLDLRTFRPLDAAAVAESVSRTGRLVLVQEGPLPGGWAATLLAQLVAGGPPLGVRPRIVASDDSPVPYSAPLEAAWLPTVERIVEACGIPVETA
jgi:pyruvate/2-oxoglutarate/acetoin dehydrogenase E1 component